jgi:hypothetical protein
MRRRKSRKTRQWTKQRHIMSHCKSAIRFDERTFNNSFKPILLYIKQIYPYLQLNFSFEVHVTLY